MNQRVYQQRIKVSWGDVDYARIIYYPKLFHFCHVVMEGFYDTVVGVPYATVVGERKIGFPTVHTEADYFVPMPYGITLLFDLTVRALGTTSIAMRFRVRADGEDTLRAEARSTVVCVDMDRFVKRPLPDDFRKAFAAYLEPPSPGS